MDAHYVLDCTGLRCPAPIIELAKAIRGHVDPGQVIRVECNDPAFPPDIQAFCNQSGNPLLALDSVDCVYIAHIRKKPLS